MRFRRTAAVTAALLVAAAFTTWTPAPVARAIPAAQWQPGNIIADQVFYSGWQMSAAQVQDFLATQYRGCDPGYTCVRDYRVSTPSRAAESGLCNGYAGAANEPASVIIAKVAETCSVNPRVLLSLIQKESGLITSTAPDYTQVTGYGCPDSTGCDADYYGFFNQVYLAARQFRLYRLYPNDYGYVAGRTNYILYNPNTACGSSPVYIQNQATAGLYDYTPYQPNAAAMNNLTGTGDACSTYGNRNFWVVYNNWFGSTQGGDALWGVTPSGTLSYYQNLVFGAPNGLPYGGGVPVLGGLTGYTLMAVGDVNGDGRPDLVATRPDGSLWLMWNTTSGSDVQSFAAPWRIGQAWQPFTRLFVADVNGDGLADLVATDSNGTLWWWPNNLYGNAGGYPYGLGIAVGGGWNGMPSMTVGDVTGDSRADIVATDRNGMLWDYQNPVTGGAPWPFSARQAIGGGWTPFTTLIAKDIQADGIADLLAIRNDGTLWYYQDQIYINPGHVPFVHGTQIGYAWQQYSRAF